MTYLDLFVICWIMCPAAFCGVIAALTTNQAGVFIEDLLPATQAPREILRVATGPAPGVRFLLIVVIIAHLGGFRRRGTQTGPTRPLTPIPPLKRGKRNRAGGPVDLTPIPLRKGKRSQRATAQSGGWDDLLVIVLVILIKGEVPLLEADGRGENTDGDEKAFEDKWAQALDTEIMLEPVESDFEAWCEMIEKGASPKRGRGERKKRRVRRGGKSYRHGGRRIKASWR